MVPDKNNSQGLYIELIQHYKQYPIEKLFIFTIYQNLALIPLHFIKIAFRGSYRMAKCADVTTR